MSRYLSIDQALRRARSALRRNDAATALAVSGVALATILLLAFALAIIGVPAISARPWFLGLAALIVLAAIGYALRPLIVPWNDDRLARSIGEKFTDVLDTLSSDIQYYHA